MNRLVSVLLGANLAVLLLLVIVLRPESPAVPRVPAAVAADSSSPARFPAPGQFSSAAARESILSPAAPAASSEIFSPRPAVSAPGSIAATFPAAAVPSQSNDAREEQPSNFEAATDRGPDASTSTLEAVPVGSQSGNEANLAATVPVAFAQEAAGPASQTPEQRNAVQNIQHQFIDNLKASPTQNFNAPAYAWHWNASQSLADDRLRAQIGFDAFNALQTAAVQDGSISGGASR